LNTLVENGISSSDILQVLSEGKFDSRWEEMLSKSDFQSFIGAYMVPAVGASGAIYGVLVAFAFMFPDAELALMFIPIPIKAKYFVPVIVGLDLFSGVTGFSVFGDGIAHFAHVGGALIGFLMMWYWKKNQFQQNRWN
jgi:membrane associated rhomboid family serine protease